MSVNLNETLKKYDFSGNNPERHNSDSSVEFLMVFFNLTFLSYLCINKKIL